MTYVPAILLLLVLIGFGQARAQEQTIQTLDMLIGKRVIVQRIPLCSPGTFTIVLTYAGKQATVVSLKPSRITPLSQNIMNKLPPETRAMFEDQQKGATMLVKFEDGTTLDSCGPVTPRSLADHFELVPGQTLEPAAPVAAPVAAPDAAPPVAQAQTPDSQSVTEPQFTDTFYRLDAAGKLIPLERQTATIEAKASGFIVMNMKSLFEIPGGQSPLRFRTAETLEFVVRSFVATAAVDPNTLYSLHKLDKKKNKREMVVLTGHASPVEASINTNPVQGVLAVEFSHYGKSSLKISAGTLPPGEYALSPHAFAQTIFCFGVD